MRPVTPIANITRRIPEAGRIRIGVRSGKAMKALDSFRFTSPDQQAVEQIAATYGGEVKPWSDPKAAAGQFEVITPANEIAVVLPPDPLGGSPSYELWGGGGCERRCDGLTAQIQVHGPDGIEPQDVPCVCVAKNCMECKVVTHLSVILPEVRFTGVWRLTSKSWNVAQEMPGFVDLIAGMQDRGLTRGVLRLERRKSVSGNQTRNFVVPVLGITETMDALASGMAQVGTLGAGSSAPVAALGAGPSGEVAADPPQPVASPDDEVIDAELVQSLADLLPAGVSASKALVAVRDAAKARGIDPPMNIAEVTDPVLISAALDLLAPA